MIYTTYFAKRKTLPADVAPVAISRDIPYWFEGEHFPKLAPSRKLLAMYRATKDVERYKVEFNKQLALLNPEEVVGELQALVESKQIALVCYEKSGEFCHRQLVSDWLNAAGFECQEWIPE